MNVRACDLEQENADEEEDHEANLLDDVVEKFVIQGKLGK